MKIQRRIYTCVLFTEQWWQGYLGNYVQRQRIPAHHYWTGDRHFHHHPAVDRVLPVLLSAPAVGYAVEKIAHQRVLQR